MKRIIQAILVAAPMLLVVTSCNKTKINSNRLIKAGMWKVTELTVAGVSEAELPEWEIADCDIYKNSCTGEWKNEEGGHAEFIWQFRDKGDTFEISRQGEVGEHSHSHDHAEEEAIEQCFAFSGVYSVVEHEKTKMTFTSLATRGHWNEEVIIKIEKK